MKKSFSKSWISSKQKRKQRKYRANAPLHIRKNFVSANLSKPLREKYKKRSLPIRKGDGVIVMRGSFKGKSGKVERVDLKKGKVYISEISYLKKDGSKVHPPIDPSNLQITNLTMDDKKRFGKKSAKAGGSKESSNAESKEKEKQKESNEKQPKDKEVKLEVKEKGNKKTTEEKSKESSTTSKPRSKAKSGSNKKSQKSKSVEEKNQNVSD